MRFIHWSFIVPLALLCVAGPATAASTHAKHKKASAKKPATAAAPAAPVDNGPAALASCKKHVENMLKSPATQFENENAIRVVKADAENFDVAGGVHSANAGGQPIGGNFNCHAQLIGGAVWSTKTSLDFAR
jgi:hypothetical protein